MRYFTREWCEEMQVAGFLAFHETVEDWEEELAYYTEEGIDYKANNLRNLEDMRTNLLKFLPESFHPYIHDGTISESFPQKDLRDMAKQWERDYESRMEALGDEYSRQYEEIKGELPAGAVQLMEQSLHDAVVISVEKPSDEIVVIKLDCSGGFHYFTDIQLTFTGVTKENLPLEFKGAWWLYNEIYLTEDGGFELHVLFDTPMTEAEISAQDVNIEVLA